MIPNRPTFRRIFLHFFDVHYLELKTKNANSMRRRVHEECRRATRFAVLSAEEVLVPASSYFESPECFGIVSELAELFQYGYLNLVGSALNVQEFADAKLSQYPLGSPQYSSYKSLTVPAGDMPPFATRKNSSTADICAEWLRSGAAGFMEKVAKISDRKVISLKNVENRWGIVPELLDGRAFVLSHVAPLLFEGTPAPDILLNRLSGVINEAYFLSYTREFCAGIVADLNDLAAPHAVPSFDSDLPFKPLLRRSREVGLLDRIDRADVSELLRIRDSDEWKLCLAAACGDYDRKISAASLGEYMKRGGVDDAIVGIITALPEEFAAVSSVFGCNDTFSVSGQGAGRKYAEAQVTTKNRSVIKIVVGLMTDMGNNSAAIRATHMINHFQTIKNVLMVGIAGGVPNPSSPKDHVRLGDIVVSDQRGVVQYDMDKELPTEIECRSRPRPPGASLIEIVQHLEADALLGKRPWERYLSDSMKRMGASWSRPSDESDVLKGVQHPQDKDRQCGQPKVFTGTIASANKLLKNPEKRDALRDIFGVKAVEMEGSGVADATWNSEVGYIVVRGICDYCDPQKNDDWHNYAALAAAAYSRALIEAL